MAGDKHTIRVSRESVSRAKKQKLESEGIFGYCERMMIAGMDHELRKKRGKK